MIQPRLGYYSLNYKSRSQFTTLQIVSNTMIILLFLLSFTNLCKSNSVEKFEVEYQWTFINFTWPNEKTYNDAITNKTYIPENNAMAGIKFYKDKIYIAIPRARDGVPATLGYISINDSKINPLITPFPNWEMNQEDSCDKINSVQSMEIDENGIMWVLDGFRIRDMTDCPSKLVLIDLNQEAKIIHSYVFPEHICLSKGGFLNDIVVDGDFAYITDNSAIDPGLIIYSRKENTSWKIRDASMFAQKEASNYVVDGREFGALAPIDGIALSPLSAKPRFVYYCALTSFNLYSISTDILKNQEICSEGAWRAEVNLIGKKQAQSDGMMMDNKGNLYYGLLPLHGVGKWNTNEPFSKAEIVERDNDTMIWTDSFAFDDKGYLYLLCNNIHRFFDPGYETKLTDKVMFRILKLSTSTKSYLH